MGWPYRYTPYIWPNLIAAALFSALAVYTWRRRAISGATPFAIMLLFAIFWSLAATMELAAVELPSKFFWSAVLRYCAMPAATAGIWFALEYTRNRPLSRRSLILLSIPLLIGTVAILTNSVHHWLWPSFSLEDGDVYALRGGLAWTMLGYGYLLALAAGVLFVRLFVRSSQHRWVAALILFELVLTRAAFTLDQVFHVNPFRPMDLTVLVWLASAAVYGLALFGFRMFDPIPLARQTVIQQMLDGMMVLDTDGRIVDFNPAAMSILGRPANHLQGQNVAKWLPGCAGIVSGPAARKPAQTEISLGPDGALRDYELNLSPLKDRNDVLLGSLLLLHDVTAQRQTQAQILEQQRALAALRERELVARELHDGLGQVLGYVKMQTQAARDRLAQNQTKAADHNLAQLLAVAQDAHADLREYILGATSVTHTHTSFLDTLGQYLRAFNEHYALHAELVAPADLKDDTFEPTVEAQLLRIIQEALTNARKHARAQCVEVRMQLDGCRAQVIVQDDGAGFDPALPGTAQAQKYGLGFMRERAEAVGGSVEIHSAPGVGTQVIISVPRRQPTTLSDLDVRNMERR